MKLRIKAKLVSLALLNAIVLLKEPSISYAEDCVLLEIESRSIDDKLEVDAIKILDTIKIMENADTNSNFLDYIPKNHIIVPDESIDDWYKITYCDVTGYIKASNTEKVVIEDMPYEYIETGYLTKDSYLFDSSELSKEIDELNMYEFVEIYKQFDNAFLVKADNQVGFVKKECVEFLDYEKPVVVMDISDQDVKVYEGGKEIFEAPIVSGNYSTNKKYDHSTGLGLYQIFEKSRNRDLVGPNNSYRSYVNYMMKFNKNGEGLHDANYHIDESGKMRGWRSDWEFGGDTYDGDGSHGCGNMKYKDAKKLYEIVDYETKVLVKE